MDTIFDIFAGLNEILCVAVVFLIPTLICVAVVRVIYKKQQGENISVKPVGVFKDLPEEITGMKDDEFFPPDEERLP